MAVQEFTINNEKVRLLKLAKVGETIENNAISDKERAMFILESNINALE